MQRMDHRCDRGRRCTVAESHRNPRRLYLDGASSLSWHSPLRARLLLLFRHGFGRDRNRRHEGARRLSLHALARLASQREQLLPCQAVWACHGTNLLGRLVTLGNNPALAFRLSLLRRDRSRPPKR
jgi:hypothetical protein